MDKVRIYRSGTQVEVDPTSLPEATTLAKGAVTQGDGVAKDTFQESTADKRINTILDSLRHSGVIANDKFVVFYDKNFPQGVEDGSNFPIDTNVYLSGQTATVKFEDSDERVPYCSGHNFIGWALSPSAVTPDYPYDENDPQTYTVTFTDNDIVLYAVWEAATVTITYSLGEYGTGSVPSPQTVTEGAETQLSFSPTPTVNDGSGRVFVGWSYEDGATNYGAADFRQDGTTYIYPYSDITLYPVFAAQYTLTYALGNDATGSVPSPVTAYDGQNVYLDFMTYPTCLSDSTRAFIGWNTSDGQSVAMYSAMGTSEIYMSSDVTLYPAFEAAQVTYTCTYYNGMYSTGSVPSTSTGSLMGTTVWYTLDFTTYPTCTRAGTWNFIGWDPLDGKTSNPTYPASGITSISVSPAANLTLYPVFEEQGGGGTAGTIEVVNNSTKGYDVTIKEGKSTVILTVAGNTSDSFTFTAGTSYNVVTSMTVGSFTGVYKGVSYTNQTLTYSGDHFESPASVQNSEPSWTFNSGDYGTITVS